MVPSCVVISCCVEEPGFFVVEELELLPPVPGFEGFVGSEGSMAGFLSDITLIIATGEKLSNVKYQFPSLSYFPSLFINYGCHLLILYNSLSFHFFR